MMNLNELGLIETDNVDILTARMRLLRDRMLAASDWTQTLDAPLNDEKRAAWATYRQALRDAPDNWEPAPTWDAPDPPA